MLLDRTSGYGSGSVRRLDRLDVSAPVAGDELRLPGVPRSLTGADLSHQVRPVTHVHDEAQRTLTEGLGDGAGQGEPEVGGRVADTPLEEMADPRLAVGHGDDRRQLARDRCRPEELAEHAHAEPDRVGAEGGEVAEQRLGVAR